MVTDPKERSAVNLVVEVLLVYAATIGLIWGTEFLVAFEEFQRRIFVHPIISSFISLALLPILMLAWKGKQGVPSVFKMEKLRKALRFGGKTMIISGLSFGIIREKGGSFLAPALVHGFTIIFPVIFA